MQGEHATDQHAIQRLIAKAKASGGSERANYQNFIRDLCAALGLPGPDWHLPDRAQNDYVFER